MISQRISRRGGDDADAADADAVDAPTPTPTAADAPTRRRRDDVYLYHGRRSDVDGADTTGAIATQRGGAT